MPDGDTLRVYKGGDQFILTAGASYLGQALSLSGNITYQKERASLLNGFSYSKTGDIFTADASANYQWDQRHSSNISVQYNHTKRNQTLDFLTGSLGSESKNSNSDVYSISLGHSVNISQTDVIGINLTLLKRDANLYDPSSDFYVPAKMKTIFGGSYQKRLGNNVSIDGSLSYFTVTQSETPYLPKQQYNGIKGHVAVDLKF